MKTIEQIQEHITVIEAVVEDIKADRRKLDVECREWVEKNANYTNLSSITSHIEMFNQRDRGMIEMLQGYTKTLSILGWVLRDAE